MQSSDGKWFLYVAECADRSWYCGVSTSPLRRVWEHNHSPKGSKYCRARLPVFLVFTQECASKSDALRKEAAFKKLTKREKGQYVLDESARKRA